MKIRFWSGMAVLVVALGLAGCGGDMVGTMMKDPQMQGKIMDMITSNAGMAGTMVDKMMGDEATKKMIMDKISANAPMMQEMAAKIASDPAMVENVLNMAVKDPAMKTKIMDWVKMASKPS